MLFKNTATDMIDCPKSQLRADIKAEVATCCASAAKSPIRQRGRAIAVRLCPLSAQRLKCHQTNHKAPPRAWKVNAMDYTTPAAERAQNVLRCPSKSRQSEKGGFGLRPALVTQSLLNAVGLVLLSQSLRGNQSEKGGFGLRPALVTQSLLNVGFPVSENALQRDYLVI